MNKHQHKVAHDEKRADIQKCKAHREANSYGMPLNYNTKCECCGKFRLKEPLTWNFSLIKIYYCGPQLVTYLTVVKYLAVLLFVMSITSALPLMIINYKGKWCEKKANCFHSPMLYYSIFNQFDHRKKMAEISYIIFANFVICVVFWHILRNQLRKIKIDIDETNFIPNQYVALCQLPSTNVEKSLIVQKIQKWWKLELKHNRLKMQKAFPKLYENPPVKKNIKKEDNISNQVQQLCNLDTKQSPQYIEQVIFSYNHPQFVSQSKLIEINQKQLGQKQERLNNQSSIKKTQLPLDTTLTLDSLNRNRFCLIIFRKPSYAEYFSENTNPYTIQKLMCFQNFRNLYINKKVVNVSSMHYPSQILWKNHHIQRQQNWKLVLSTVGCMALIISIGSGLIYLLGYLYETYVSLMKNFLNQAYFILVGVLINIIIVIGNKIITIFSQRQRHQTYSSEKSSYVYKIVILNVFLILISPLIIFKCLNTDILWQRNGFIETEVISLVIYMIAIQIERYLSPKTLKIIRQYSKFQRESQKDISQGEANRIFNKPSHQIDQQYASICTIAFSSFFLSCYAPYVIIISCIWMIIQYWIEKANIAFFYNQDSFHSQLLGNKVVELIQFSFSFLIYGNLSAYTIQLEYFDQEVQIHLAVLYSLFCAYFFVSIFLPHEKINKKIFSYFGRQDSLEAQECFNCEYRCMKDRFLQLYEDFNEALFFSKKKEQKNRTDKAKQAYQMQSITASLSLSLKQRLLKGNDPIIKHMEQKSPENEDYFEYEKKINMKKLRPKVNIPPLFQKNNTFRPSKSSIQDLEKTDK